MAQVNMTAWDRGAQMYRDSLDRERQARIDGMAEERFGWERDRVARERAAFDEVQRLGQENRRLLEEHGLVASMSKKGDCWDNAVAESFFASLETELIQEANWDTRAAARQAIFEYVEAWYNRERRHSSLGYRSPVQYEAEVFSSRVAA